MHWRFLEISLASDDLLASLDFYRLLGFTELATHDAHQHPYAVMSDGRANIGLHGREAPGPALCFVLPGLAESLAAGAPAGLSPTATRLGEDDFHRASFVDADGHALTVLEARTFSPPQSSDAADSMLGYFEGIGIPSQDLVAGAGRWEGLGFVAMDDPASHQGAVTMTSDTVNLVLQAAPQPREPSLLFTSADVTASIEALKQRGVALTQEIPGAHGVQFRTPEGLLIRLLSDS